MKKKHTPFCILQSLGSHSTCSQKKNKKKRSCHRRSGPATEEAVLPQKKKKKRSCPRRSGPATEEEEEAVLPPKKIEKKWREKNG